MSADAERWLPVVGYEGLYEVSDQGRIKSFPRETSKGLRGGGNLKPVRHASGYLFVNLYKNCFCCRRSIHSLVAEAFIGPRPLGFNCCHNNGKPDDNRLANLRWDTQAGNLADRKSHGTANCGGRNGQAKISEQQARAIRLDTRVLSAIAIDHGISKAQASRIKRRAKWAHIP